MQLYMQSRSDAILNSRLVLTKSFPPLKRGVAWGVNWKKCVFFLSSVRNVFFNGEEEVEDVKEERERPPAQLASILFKGTSRLTDYLFVEKN